jgi:sporulation and spore germination protein
LWSLLSLLSFSAACERADLPQTLSAGSRTRKTRIFMVQLERGKASGPEIGCGGSLEAVEVELPVPTPALRGSLEALLDAGEQYQSAGFYNSLAHSPLRLQRIERKGGAAKIYLAGYLELGGDCDGSRVLEQLTETATQFRDVSQAEFFLDGKPLRDLLSGKGS